MSTQAVSSQNLTTPQAEPIKKESMKSKVWKVFKKILVSIVGVALFLLNPTIFAIGLFVGLALPDKVKEIVETITNLWKKKAWIAAPLTIGGCILSLPVTLSVASAIVGGRIGAWLRDEAKSIMQPKKEKQDCSK